jgi:hypothetical protein
MKWLILGKWPLLGSCFLVCGLGTNETRAEMRYPTLCCPNTCKPVDRVNAFVRIGDGSLRRGVRRGSSVLPFADNVFIGEAPDNQVHACVGFDAFGDEEIKCLFTPPLM